MKRPRFLARNGESRRLTPSLQAALSVAVGDDARLDVGLLLVVHYELGDPAPGALGDAPAFLAAQHGSRNLFPSVAGP